VAELFRASLANKRLNAILADGAEQLVECLAIGRELIVPHPRIVELVNNLERPARVRTAIDLDLDGVTRVGHCATQRRMSELIVVLHGLSRLRKRRAMRLTPELSGHINREAIDWSA